MPSSTAPPDHLIHTKFYPPRAPVRMVSRQGLINRLNADSWRPVTLISASAGYGKSTLAHEWLKINAKPFAWYSVDAYDSKLDLFLEYLISALGTVYPEMGQEAKNTLKQPLLPGPERLADALLRDIQDISQPVFLTIDDYHTIRNEDVHLFMTRLMQRLPADLHLLLISRVDPPLALAQLRGRGELQEIRSIDLRFTPQEAGALIEQIVGEPLEDEIVTLLTKRTEGWPVGLRMIAMSLRTTSDYREFVRRYEEGSHRLVSDYLVAEVLDQLPDEQRHLLLRASVVDRFCAPLIDALAEESIPGINGYEFLEQLWSANFFLVALDDQGFWYRFHHLFLQLLQQQLVQAFSGEAIARMHLLASHWFENAGLIEDAIIHALKAGEAERAAKIIEKRVHDLADRENWRLLERWVSLLPEMVLKRPGMLAIRAMLEQFRYSAETMMSLLDAAEDALESDLFDYSPSEKRAWSGVINTYRAHYVLAGQTPENIIRYAQEALRQVDPTALYVYSHAELMEILGLQQCGRADEALQLAQKRLAGQVGLPNVRTSRLMLAQTGVYYYETNALGMRPLVEAYREIAVRMNHAISVSWANYFLGWSYYQENKLVRAEAYFAEVVEQRHFAHVRAAIDAMTGLALTQSARAKHEEVQNSLQIMRDFILQQGVMAMLPIADSLALRLDSNSIQLPTRSRMVADLKSQMANDLWELPALTACAFDIRNGRPQRLTAAQNTLIDCQTFAQNSNNKHQLIRIGALQALLHDASGERKVALESLRNSVLIGEPGGALRHFVDLGPDLIPLLRALHDQGVAAAYIDRILRAFGEVGSQGSTSPADAESEAPEALSATAAALMAELTNREMDVLILLGERLTNKEIARQLYISPSTVKKYTHSLYQKLEVSSRRQAVARALELGILPRR